MIWLGHNWEESKVLIKQEKKVPLFQKEFFKSTKVNQFYEGFHILLEISIHHIHERNKSGKDISQIKKQSR